MRSLFQHPGSFCANIIGTMPRDLEKKLENAWAALDLFLYTTYIAIYPQANHPANINMIFVEQYYWLMILLVEQLIFIYRLYPQICSSIGAVT